MIEKSFGTHHIFHEAHGLKRFPKACYPQANPWQLSLESLTQLEVNLAVTMQSTLLDCRQHATADLGDTQNTHTQTSSGLGQQLSESNLLDLVKDTMPVEALASSVCSACLQGSKRLIIPFQPCQQISAIPRTSMVTSFNMLIPCLHRCLLQLPAYFLCHE